MVTIVAAAGAGALRMIAALCKLACLLYALHMHRHETTTTIMITMVTGPISPVMTARAVSKLL